MTLRSSAVWFISGCSSGLGRALARSVLDHGARAVVTARDPARVADLAAGAGDRALVVPLDVTDAGQIAAAVGAAEARFGRIDVLVNNAGYGYQATVEEGEEAEIRAQFDANVFGLFALTRAVLPGMRARGHGRVLNVTSVAGHVGFAASGYYAATKHAVEGWSGSLDAEVAPLGIRVTCVAPGPFRTDWAGRSLRQTPTRIDAYAATAGARMDAARQRSGRQPGDPELAAELMLRLAALDAPPRHVVLGASGLDSVTRKLRAKLADIEAWREAGLATDRPLD